MRIFRPFLIFGCLLFFISCNPVNKIQKSKDYDYMLSKADEFYAKKKYKFAQPLYESLFPVFKGTQKFEDLYYKYAYCFYYQKSYQDAQNLFKGYLEVFPNSSRAEEVDYMKALSFYKESPKIELDQANTVRAMNMMQTFINTHPGSERIKEASAIIDLCRAKLEQKEYRGAHLYYNLGQYRAAAIAFGTLLNSYPESAKADEYKLLSLKSYYKFAQMSIREKQAERYETVVTEFDDFADRFPESPLLKEAESFKKLSQNKIKEIQDEQASSSVKR